MIKYDNCNSENITFFLFMNNYSIAFDIEFK